MTLTQSDRTDIVRARTLHLTGSTEGQKDDMLPTVVAEAQLRGRNQITIPDRIVKAAGIEPGETFVVELEPGDPDTVRLRRVRTSYAGALRGVYGDMSAYLDEERNSWSEET